MIEFSGEYSDISKRYLVKKLADGTFLSFFITSLIFALIILAVAIIYDLWVITIFLGALVFCDISALIVPRMKREQSKTLALMLPKKIKITEDGTIEVIWEQCSIAKSINDVKKVIDIGECYYIVFSFPKERDVLCQKSLISQGSIEEFEKIFEGKIIKKSK